MKTQENIHNRIHDWISYHKEKLHSEEGVIYRKCCLFVMIIVIKISLFYLNDFGKITYSPLDQLSTDLRRFVGEVSSLRSAAAGIQTLSEEVSALNAQIV
jgi:hypothetical protein